METGMALEKVGRYAIIGELGKGAMGVVYRATDPTIGRTVALKTMRLDVHGLDAEEMLARFRNEARLAGVLNHPNIVTIYDAGETDGLFYIAMEYIEGETLHHLLQQRRVLPVEQVIDLATQICAGLDEASAHEVVHRDIKPANIMIVPDGSIKIMDFGIAKSGGGMTSTNQVLGTPNYMSPEQVKGKPLDGRSDLFSFGVILYEIVAGEKPFIGDNVTTIIYKILNENPTPPRDLDVAVHPVLSDIIMRALAKAPEDRFQHGSELVHDLLNYQSIASAEDPTTTIPSGAYAIKGGLAASAAPGGDSGALRASAATPQFAGGSSGAAAAVAPARRLTPPRSFAPRPLAARAGMLRATNTKSLPAMVAGIFLLVVIAFPAIIGYVHHTQAQQRAEMVRLLARQRAESTTPPPITPALKPAQAAPSTSQHTQPSAKGRTGHGHGRASSRGQKSSALGEVVVGSTPPGARIQIDGRPLTGLTTPFTATGLLPGLHTLAFTKPGYWSETRMVQVTAGKKARVEARLSRISVSAARFASATTSPANTSKRTVASPSKKSARKNWISAGKKTAVSVNTTPAGAHVMVNGAAQSARTPLKITLAPGEYRLTLQLAGYKPLRRALKVEKSTPLEIDEVLQKQ
jgi:predicted Ser/Thr protein kinase